MADLTKIEITAVTTDSGGSIEHDRFELTVAKSKHVQITPDEVWHLRIECDTVAGTDIDISVFASILACIVKNLDTANFVSISHDNAAAATVVMKALAGDAYLSPDVDPSATFNITADTAACVCEAFFAGS